MKLPEALYLGPPKAGSTWLHRLLQEHPGVYVPSVKELFYFDRYYDRGPAWYARHFEGADPAQVAVDISHDYLYSTAACARVAADVPRARFLVFLREPAARAFSSWLFSRRHGIAPPTFEEAIEADPAFVEAGLYAKHLAPWIRTFGRDRFHLALYDDLVADPQRFASDVFRFLGVPDRAVPPDLDERVLGAGEARVTGLARIVKRTAVAARDAGLERLVARLKASSIVQRSLYRTYNERERPRLSEETRRRLRPRFADDVRRLDALVPGVAARWGYA